MSVRAVVAPSGGGVPVGVIVPPGGTPGTIPRWDTATTLTDSPLTVSGSNVTGAGAIRATGTAESAPAFTGSNTDTGLYFPAANQMRFATAGVFAVAIDASQNVGCGTTSPFARVSARGASGVGIGAWSTSGASPGAPVAASLFLGDDNFYNAGFYNQCPGLSAVYDATRGNSAALALYYYNGGSRTEGARLDGVGNLQFNSGHGSVATAYGCRAWVNFNGSGVVAIRASGNVSSITDNGVGYYTINLTTAMPDANYAALTTATHPGGSPQPGMIAPVDTSIPATASAYTVYSLDGNNTPTDSAFMYSAIFR